MDRQELVGLLTDAETSLLAGNYFEHRIEEEFKKSRRFGWTLSLILIEAQGLDAIAAEGGDGARKTALLNVAGTVLTESRDVDLSARTGPARFAMLLPGTEADGAQHMVQRVMTSVLDGADERMTLSVGITDAPRDGLDTVDEFVARAEQALETARAQGPNQLVTWTAPA